MKSGLDDYKTEIEKFGAISFVPNGNSMWPIIKHRAHSIVVIKKTERLKKFDVGFFTRENGSPVLHRVIEVLDDGYTFCGDSQLSTEMVKEGQVFGVLDGIYFGKKYVSVKDKKYLKKVKCWYNHTIIRKLVLRVFNSRFGIIFKKRRVKTDD